jgi:hypothetical protein
MPPYGVSMFSIEIFSIRRFISPAIIDTLIIFSFTPLPRLHYAEAAAVAALLLVFRCYAAGEEALYSAVDDAAATQAPTLIRRCLARRAA